jgi:DNA primase
MNDLGRTPLWRRVKDEINIVQLAERYAELRRSGTTRFVCRCLCGHNRDRHPSFILYEKNNDFHCFACQAHGSVIDLEMLVSGLDFRAAVSKLAQEFGIWQGNEPGRERLRAPFVALSAAPQDKGEIEPTSKATLNAANAFFVGQLQHTHAVRNWLMAQRGLNDETMHVLKIGYAHGDGLARALFRQGISLRQAQRAGLLRPSARRQEHLSQRVTFPVLDTCSDVVYLMGRAIHNDQQPKYLGLAEGTAYKRPMCFGSVKHRAIFVEGCFDVAALKQWRVDERIGIVGLLGTAHEQLLAQVALPPQHDGLPDWVALDQDWAGKLNALKVVAALNKRRRQARIVFDLDRHEALIRQTRFDSPEQRSKIEQEIALGRDILDKGLARVVHWANAGDSPGKLLRHGLRGQDLFAQALA